MAADGATLAERISGTVIATSATAIEIGTVTVTETETAIVIEIFVIPAMARPHSGETSTATGLDAIETSTLASLA